MTLNGAKRELEKLLQEKELGEKVTFAVIMESDPEGVWLCYDRIDNPRPLRITRRLDRKLWEAL